MGHHHLRDLTGWRVMPPLIVAVSLMSPFVGLVGEYTLQTVRHNVNSSVCVFRHTVIQTPHSLGLTLSNATETFWRHLGHQPRGGISLGGARKSNGGGR